MNTATAASFVPNPHAHTIRDSDDLFRLVIEASPNGLLVVGPGGTIALVNRALEQLFGYARNELNGQTVELLLPEALPAAHAQHRWGDSGNPGTQPGRAGGRSFGECKDGSKIPVEIGLNTIHTKAGKFVLASVVGISEWRPREDEHRRMFNEHVEVERLVAALSAKFVNLEAAQLDDAIRDGQRSMVEALDLDQSFLFQLSEDKNDFVLTHHWARLGEQQPPLNMLAQEQFPWSLAKIRSGEAPSFSSVEQVPDAVERETLRHYGIKSNIAIPMLIGGRTVGAIAFASTRRVTTFPEEMIVHLQLVAQVFSGALARKRAEAVLRASEDNFRTLANNAPAMIWVGDRERSRTWFNRRWLELVGQTMEDQSGSGWARCVHPDDLEMCLEIYTKAFNSRQPFVMEYRLRRHDGEWRWVLDNGTPNHAGEGSFEGYIGSCVDVTEQKEMKLQLENSLVEVQRLGDKLHAENVYLRSEVQERYGSGPVLGRSAAIRRALEQIEQVATTDSTVLLMGETGTGKELFATQVHEMSSRRNRTMVRVNCAAIPTSLIESELFGREKGAYTGALTRHVGRFELADHSTIFLDEIGDLPLEIQVKLLRVMEERQIERLGSSRGIPVDIRIIAATHRNLEQRISEGEFREDLFYRFNVFPVRVPPLRERTEDIPLLVWRFVGEFAKTFGKQIESISRENMAALQEYPWPGNIRELRNVVERAMIGATGTRLTVALPTPQPAASKKLDALQDIEREHIRNMLEGCAWRIRGAGGAAARLGLKPTTLETRMAKLGLTRSKPI